MSHHSAAFSARSRTLLAISLCVLALAFAMEAKTAWYGPAGQESGISSAKALPIDSPKLVQHGVSAPAPVHSEIAFALLTILAASWSMSPEFSLGRPTLRRGTLVSSADYFSPPSFLRPPPIF